MLLRARVEEQQNRRGLFPLAFYEIKNNLLPIKFNPADKTVLWNVPIKTPFTNISDLTLIDPSFMFSPR